MEAADLIETGVDNSERKELFPLQVMVSCGGAVTDMHTRLDKHS